MAAAGLETAAGVLAVVGVAYTFFNDCIKSIALVAAARHADQDVERIRFMVEWEEFRMLQWAERVGFGNEQPNPTVINWALAYELLDRLQKDLANVEALKEKYNLAVDTEQQKQDVSTVNSPVGRSQQSTGVFTRLRSHTSRSMQKIHKRAIEKGTTTYRGLKWAAIDQEKVRHLIADITYFNDCLRDLLNSAQQEYVSAGMTALLRDLVSRSSNDRDLEVIKAMLDADTTSREADLRPEIELKHTRLMAGVDKRKDERWLSSTQSPKLSRIKYDGLTSLVPSDRDNWENAVYKIISARKNINSQVLLEWKVVPKVVDGKIAKRIMELTFLLSTASTSFHTLKCLGFVKRDLTGDMNKYAYVFELVDLRQNPQARMLTPKRLRSYIDCNKQLSLTKRISISSKIAQTVLQLHTAGWLHKNISAESILFLQEVGNEALQEISGPFLCGFEASRLNAEDTEAAILDPVSELYRHPSYQTSTSSRGYGFCKTYDLYSLGCVLLEIILWSSFESILYQLVAVYHLMLIQINQEIKALSKWPTNEGSLVHDGNAWENSRHDQHAPGSGSGACLPCFVQADHCYAKKIDVDEKRWRYQGGHGNYRSRM